MSGVEGPHSAEPVAPSFGASPVVEPLSSASTPKAPASGPRPIDDLDRAVGDGFVDLHADTFLHNGTLEGDGNFGPLMYLWRGFIWVLALFEPNFKNFFRHVDEESLNKQGRGVQGISAVSQGLPPWHDASFKAYTGAIADVPGPANDTPFNAALFQFGLAHVEAKKHTDRLVLAHDADSTAEAMRRGYVALHLSIEGAFPLEVREGDLEAFRKLRDDRTTGIPRSFFPPEHVVMSREGRLAWFADLGVNYIGLNHLGSSCYSGSDLWPGEGEGLSADGIALIKSMERQGVMLDMAHASQKAQTDVVRLVKEKRYTLPLMVSHARVRLPDEDMNWRMTQDEIIDAVKDTGGVVGVMFARTHLPHGKKSWWEWLLLPVNPFIQLFKWLFMDEGAPFVRDVVDQIDALKKRVGVDHIAFGSDGDGFVGLPYDNVTECVEAVIAEMKKRGYTDDEILKIRGGNYLHTLERRDTLMRQRRASYEHAVKTPDAPPPQNLPNNGPRGVQLRKVV